MTTIDREPQDLLETLAKHRGFRRQTLDGLDDEQIRASSTVSALCLGGIVKHVTEMERMWSQFAVQGADAFAGATPEHYAAQWALEPTHTAVGLLEDYEQAAAAADAIILAHADLDAEHLLPEAPWFPPGTAWSNRRVALHLIAETAQHAGHADIIRESIDGARTMG